MPFMPSCESELLVATGIWGVENTIFRLRSIPGSLGGGTVASSITEQRTAAFGAVRDE